MVPELGAGEKVLARAGVANRVEAARAAVSVSIFFMIALLFRGGLEVGRPSGAHARVREKAGRCQTPGPSQWGCFTPGD